MMLDRRSVLVCLAALAGAAQPAFASDGTVTFQGRVTGETCTINSGTPNFTVTMPTISTSTLGTDGTTSGRTSFSIVLSGCSLASGTVSAYFEQGANTLTSQNRLKNNGTATNVAVQLLTPGFAVIQLGNGAGSQGGTSATLASGAARLNYYAEYIATGGAATAGTVATSTTYSIVYP